MSRPRPCRRPFARGALWAGRATGCVQANLAVLPQEAATEFVNFCGANAATCPVRAVGAPGDPHLAAPGSGLDVHTDLPSYWIFRDARRTETAGDITTLWRKDFVAVAIGCWFSMEEALLRAGVRLRHVELGIQGPLFHTAIETMPVGRLGGPLVVSMRPFSAHEVATVRALTARFARVHGAPIHEGGPGPLGIADLTKPDFGGPIPIGRDDVPLYWGCGLTALAALQRSGLGFFITHAPGAMLVTDLRT